MLPSQIKTSDELAILSQSMLNTCLLPKTYLNHLSDDYPGITDCWQDRVQQNSSTIAPEDGTGVENL